MKLSVATQNGARRKVVELEDMGRDRDGSYVTRFCIDGADHFNKFTRAPQDLDQAMLQKRETLDLAFLASIGLDPSDLEFIE